MAYGFSTRTPATRDAQKPVLAAIDGSPSNHWRTLSEACRLKLVERALIPLTNNVGDGFPAAL